MVSEHETSSQDNTLIFGTRALIEALEAGKEFEKIFIQRDLNNPLIRELKQQLKQRDFNYLSVPAEKLDRLTRKNHQGAVGFLSLVNYFRTEEIVPALFSSSHHPVLLMLDRVTDVRNFGAICRSAECFGVAAVIVPERGAAMINGDTVKASAGAMHRINICREPNLKNTIDYLKDSGFAIVGCTEKGTKTVYDHSFDGPTCIIMGSESDGISHEYLKRCTETVLIPMQGKVSSLNVSVATGIVLYEVNRQLGIAKNIKAR
jgi:23S rRNA (guanosine2251-2'-O)-methyltransferase